MRMCKMLRRRGSYALVRWEGEQQRLTPRLWLCNPRQLNVTCNKAGTRFWSLLRYRWRVYGWAPRAACVTPLRYNKAIQQRSERLRGPPFHAIGSSDSASALKRQNGRDLGECTCSCSTSLSRPTTFDKQWLGEKFDNYSVPSLSYFLLLSSP